MLVFISLLRLASAANESNALRVRPGTINVNSITIETTAWLCLPLVFSTFDREEIHTIYGCSCTRSTIRTLSPCLKPFASSRHNATLFIFSLSPASARGHCAPFAPMPTSGAGFNKPDMLRVLPLYRARLLF